jgi:cation:H+ antiporter
MLIGLSIILGLSGGILLLIISSFILTVTIEDIGKRGRLGNSFTGAFVSPIFTSLPELSIIIIALVTLGHISGSEIAAGTIIGEPFMVSAIGFPAMVGAIIFARRNGKIESLDPIMPVTLIFLGICFPLMLIPVFLSSTVSRVLTVLLLIAVYFLLLVYYRKKSSPLADPSSLEIKSKGLLSLLIILGLGLLIIGSVFLVRSVSSLANQTRISSQLITILIVPIGTIIPETLNSVIWAARRKINLAMGAIAGEEILFVTLYPALGIIISPWTVERSGLYAVFVGSIFFLVMGLITYKFRNAYYFYILWPIALLMFLSFIIY